MINVNIKNRNMTQNSWSSFLLGFCLCEGISTVFTVRNTGISFAQLYSVVLFIYLLSKKQRRCVAAIQSLPITFKLFLLVCAVSIIPGLIIFPSTIVLYRYFVGWIALIISLITMLDAMILADKRESIFKGVFAGVLVNIVVSIVAYITFKLGSVLTFSKIVHHIDFYVPLYVFRSQGLFLEPSHFIRFVISVFLPLMVIVRGGTVRYRMLGWIIVFLGAFVVLYSTSGSIVIGILGFILFYFLVHNKKKSRIKVLSLVMFLTLIIVFLLFVLFGKINFTNFNLLTEKIINGANIVDPSNEYRFYSITSMLKQLKEVPFGCGWNTIGNFIKLKGIQTVSTFSEILEITLETSVLGAGLYIWFLLSLSIKLLKNKTEYAIALSVTILCILALQSGTDYAFNSCIMVILGLAIVESKGQSKLNKI